MKGWFLLHLLIIVEEHDFLVIRGWFEVDLYFVRCDGLGSIELEIFEGVEVNS